MLVFWASWALEACLSAWLFDYIFSSFGTSPLHFSDLTAGSEVEDALALAGLITQPAVDIGQHLLVFLFHRRRTNGHGRSHFLMTVTVFGSQSTNRCGSVFFPSTVRSFVGFAGVAILRLQHYFVNDDTEIVWRSTSLTSQPDVWVLFQKSRSRHFLLPDHTESRTRSQEKLLFGQPSVDGHVHPESSVSLRHTDLVHRKYAIEIAREKRRGIK